jgi:cyclopropane fatty-acyl-phospholipid synthase-like methyltransferase
MKNTKGILRKLFPKTKPSSEIDNAKKHFSKVYSNNAWKGMYSRSGPGSEGTFADQKKNIITDLITTYHIKSILDIGCGDFYWMKDLSPHIQHYHGVDVVEDLVGNNIKSHEKDNVSFQCINLCDLNDQTKLSIKKADLIVCIDVFGHLLNNEVDSLLEFILNNFEGKFLLLTNRREKGSEDYLKREKTRHEGIDLEKHPLFIKHKLTLLHREPGLYPNDFFDFYQLPEHEIPQP